MDFTGERYIPGIQADFALEHRHRYILASELARGLDVLDIACGEGYGSAMLATSAKSVQGVDISPEAVAHANAHYSASNLTFLEGSAAEIPLADQSVDLVVSFETIEHHDRHQDMMREIVRVLRPGGVLCLSSPDRATNADVLPPNSNPYHVKEMNLYELEDLVSTSFSKFQTYGQRSVMGSLICGDTTNAFSSWLDTAPNTVVSGITNPKFYIVLATNGEDLPHLPTGILESSSATCQDHYELLNWKQRTLGELEAERNTHRSLLWHMEIQKDYIAGQDQRIIKLEGDRSSLHAFVAHQKRTIDALNEELATLMNSKSWRITKPMRCVAHKARTLRTRVRTVLGKIRRALVGCIDNVISGLHNRWNCWQMLHEAKPALRALHDNGISIQPWDVVKGRPDLAAYFANPDETLDKLKAIPDETQRNTAVEGFQRALCRSGSTFPDFAPDQRARVVLISGEPHTPGHAYRMARLEKALANDFQVYLYGGEEVGQHQHTILGADLLWIWRAIHTDILEELVSEVRAKGKHIIFDIDDLCFLPEMATAKYMDAIRSNGFDEDFVKRHAGQLQKMMQEADLCVASTHSLAQTISHNLACPAKVLPNCFDRTIHDRSVSARLNWKAEQTDNFIRIGYAAGTPTHQADFRAAVPALVSVLERHPQARLVLFDGFINIDEFPDLEPLAACIEWRKRVPLECLPDEMARFDINIAPLECDNPFCDAKSELKFFEAALVKVPTIASPTKPYARAIRHGENGYLASTTEEWEAALDTLLQDADLRERVGAEAYRYVLWAFGPEIKQHLGLGIVDMFISSARDKARVFVVDETVNTGLPLAVEIPEYTVDYSTGPALSKVSVVIPLHNYEVFVVQALDSLLTQTMEKFDVVVVNDASTDNSLEIVRNWMQAHADHFASVSLLNNTQNARLSLTRNAGIAYSHSEYIMLLDADNMLMPECLKLCAKALDSTSAAIAYPTIKMYGDATGEISSKAWNPDMFRFDNYIDAMVMLRKAHWVALGGFTRQDQGWEDYDFWCKMAERGFWGLHVPQVAALYRVHGSSMLHTLTDKDTVKTDLAKTMTRRHPWLCLSDGTENEQC